MSDKELKPCPLCGGKGEIFGRESDSRVYEGSPRKGYTTVKIYCPICNPYNELGIGIPDEEAPLYSFENTRTEVNND